MYRLLIVFLLVCDSIVGAVGPVRAASVGGVVADSTTGLSSDEQRFLFKKFGRRSIDEVRFADFDNDPSIVTGPFADRAGALYLTDHDIKAIFVTTYPQRWVWSEIDHIVFSPDSILVSSVYGIDEYTEGVTGMSGQLPATVTLYTRVIGDLRRVSSIYSHETGHANSWVHDLSMSEQQRWRLFYDLSWRWFNGTDCFPSSYVDEITNPDPETNNYLRVQEYWAELCQAYFDAPQELRRYPTDFHLVDRWVKRQDPAFDPLGAKSRRTDAIWDHEARQLSPQRQWALRQYRQRWLVTLSVRQLNCQVTGPTVTLGWIQGAQRLLGRWRVSPDRRLKLAALTAEWVNERLPLSRLGWASQY